MQVHTFMFVHSLEGLTTISHFNNVSARIHFYAPPSYDRSTKRESLDYYFLIQQCKCTCSIFFAPPSCAKTTRGEAWIIISCFNNAHVHFGASPRCDKTIKSGSPH
jgi:hypothetical protein